MNSIGKHPIIKSLPKIMFGNTYRGVAAWNKDWMPGPYPKTPQEREAAAKKYGLLPEEYEPDPEGPGDYPKLPDISGATKDNYYNWDHVHLKKDYNEPMHYLANIISEDRLDINIPEKARIHPFYQTITLISVMGGLFILFLYSRDKVLSLPHARQHMLGEGPHYKYPSSN